MVNQLGIHTREEAVIIGDKLMQCGLLQNAKKSMPSSSITASPELQLQLQQLLPQDNKFADARSVIYCMADLNKEKDKDKDTNNNNNNPKEMLRKDSVGVSKVRDYRYYSSLCILLLQT